MPADMTYPNGARAMEFDRFDVKLLEIVQRNNRLTSEEIADTVGLSATACQRRLKRLRDEGTIESDVSIISPKVAGRPISMLILISLEREKADSIDRFKATVRNSPEVMSAFFVTGDTDFVLVVTARDMEEYEQFARRVCYDNPDIKGFRTLVVIDRVKAGYSLPLSLLGATKALA